MNNKECQDHEGKTYSSITEMAKAWGISKHALRSRLAKGLSVEQSLTFTGKKGRKLSKDKVTDYLGNEYTTQKEMAEAWGVNPITLGGRKNKNVPMEECLTRKEYRRKPLVKKVKDHLGNEFYTEKEMIEHYEINPATYYARKSRGWTKDEILKTSGFIDKRANKVTDHEGNEFLTEKEMAEYWGVKIGTYRSRKSKGLSVKECLKVV